MGGCLNAKQVYEIKKIRAQIKQLDIEGWMCEGADDERIVFFNNEKDEMFYSDYFGNITSASCELTPDLGKYAELEGKIMQICYSDN